MTIQKIEVISEQEYINKKAELERVKVNKDENARRRREFEKSLEIVTKATDGIWEDWHRCKVHAAKLEEVRTTFDEYLEMCGGVQATAAAFLLKAYGAELCKEALKGKIEQSTSDQWFKEVEE